jgi:hypothetical protein
VQHGVLHGRRAAPGGQQREVQVDPAVLGISSALGGTSAPYATTGTQSGASSAAALELRLARRCGVSTSMPRSSAHAPAGERTSGGPRRPARRGG